ncbi:MAG: hypothetical protein U0802_23350 [Candidatus Binatia bacterium]
MQTRERQHDAVPRAAGAGPEDGGDLAAARDDADRLFAAADSAIDRALSADSKAFLEANRQHGGQ